MFVPVLTVFGGDTLLAIARASGWRGFYPYGELALGVWEWCMLKLSQEEKLVLSRSQAVLVVKTHFWKSGKQSPRQANCVWAR